MPQRSKPVSKAASKAAVPIIIASIVGAVGAIGILAATLLKKPKGQRTESVKKADSKKPISISNSSGKSPRAPNLTARSRASAPSASPKPKVRVSASQSPIMSNILYSSRHINNATLSTRALTGLVQR